MLGDAEERVSVKELMFAFSTYIAISLAALVVGLWIKQANSQILLRVFLGLAAVSGLLYFAGNHAVAKFAPQGVLLGLFSAAGISGPAFQSSKNSAIPLSIGVTMLALIGVPVVFFVVALITSGPLKGGYLG